MLYLFTGNSDFLISEAVLNWKRQFIDKYGDFNLINIKDLTGIKKDYLALNIFASGFLNEKKLIFIHLDNEINEEISLFLIEKIDNIPENNIVIFIFPNPDKRQKLYKELVKKSEKKEFNIGDISESINYIQKKYPNQISSDATKLILQYKGNNLNKAINEIEKLKIIYDFINNKDIEKNIIPEFEESVFQIIDLLLNKNINDSRIKIRTMTSEINVYAFYNNLLANLRTSLFIIKLKEEKQNNSEISSILDLGNKSFLINKNYKIQYKQLKEFYIELINLDRKMKTGNMIGTEDNDLLHEIESLIIKFLN